MTDFDTTRSALEAAREQERQARAAVAAAHQAAARLAADHAAATRIGEADELAEQVERARAEEVGLRADLQAASALAGRAAAAFAKAADPREAIANWSDETPLLLLPVRLETRFKTVTDEAGSHDELWVRFYPDACSVDTFEAALSETEVASARRYWIETWAAGGIEAQHRAAWRNLVASHGAGRAAWIVREYAPAGAPQAKADPADLLLVIATDAPPGAQEQEALSTFWTAVWVAEGDAAEVEAARQALAATPGVTDADTLIATFVPANLAAAPAPPATRADVAIDTVWLTLPPAPEAKTRSWTAPARVETLPDRFVVLGYQDDRVVFEAEGGLIPSPLIAGPDPSAPEEKQLAHDEAGALRVPDQLRWMVDFEAAVAAGMGVKVRDLGEADLTRPLQRVIAIGVRLADDASQGQARLEELLDHHRFGSAGLALVPQGTPTNNSDEAAGYDRVDDADAAYDALFGAGDALPAAGGDWWTRRDGEWLAHGLGIGVQSFDRVPHAGGTDLAEARAINRALWPATIGYALETMLHPVLDAEQVDATRWFQTHFVLGRGMLPSLRIGDQPYGILPVSAISRWDWLGGDQLVGVGGLRTPDGFIGYRQGLAGVLATMREDWRRLAQEVSFVGKRGDPHQLLLDVVGLHPGSAELHQRYAESLDDLFNRAKLRGFGAQVAEAIRVNLLQAEARALLARLGYRGEVEPDALSKFFFTQASRLNGPMVDDVAASERDPIRTYTTDGRNYVEWLAAAARGAFEDLRQERGFKDGRPPAALLYVLLRHALLLGYWDSSLRLHLEAEVWSPEDVALARREHPFVHVATERGGSESRYAALYSTDERVAAGHASVAERIGSQLGDASGVQGLAGQLAALDQLAPVPTARLERCLAEHLDVASYRLDAWLLGLAGYQLAALRYSPVEEGQARTGVHLGAYGWLEDLQRKPAPLEPVELNDELAAVFAPGGEPPLRDPANGGYVLAPSIGQANTAAILRAGYLANASPQEPGALAVNVSSARVRVALGLIEGIRNGQPLGALLGYRLQRGLHEGHPGLELDRFVYPLRKRFPLVADQLASTKTAEGVAIEAIEANNVVDGLKLVEHIARTGRRAYPFGLSLPSATQAERAAIDAEVDALLDAHDSLADLALAEGVHQAVLGNYDRVAATFDAYAKGGFPPQPDVVRTPRSGLGLTHRVALHFASGVDPDTSPIAGIPMAPRARAQAMVNQWLADLLPAPDQVGCRIEWSDPVAGTMREAVVTQADLELQPIELLYVVTLDGDAALGELEDRVLRHVIDTDAPRPDAAIAIRHTARLPAPMVSFFELAPLVRHLRSLLLRSRPLAPTDIALSGEAARGQDAAQTITRSRVEKVYTALDTLRQDIQGAAVAAPVDGAIAVAAALFERAARFGIEQVGWGHLYLWRRGVYAGLLSRIQDVIARWDDRLDRFDSGLDAYDQLPAATSDELRYSALGQLDLLVARVSIAPRPATPAAYRAALPARRAVLAAKRAELEALLTLDEPELAQFVAAVQAVLPLTDFDFDLAPFTVDNELAGIAAFVAELAPRVDALEAEVVRRLAAADGHLLAHDAAADPTTRVKALQAAGSALLGEDVTLIPEFSVDAPRAAELANALAAATDPAFTAFIRNSSGSDFPVDDWLHGVARVREQLHAWEQANALAATFGADERELVPLQLPYRPGEGWLALEFDPAAARDGERLLYTAHLADPQNLTGSTCGVLLDEWTEVVPAREETVGMTFHYDRPGSEPPQSWLLVTPAKLGAGWRWDDVLGALEETLDLARLRAVEPAHIDTTAYARFLPATTTAVTLYGITIAANFATVNHVIAYLPGDDDG